MVVWVGLFYAFNDLAENWSYPAILVLGAFVAGLAPEGCGAKTFPVLSVLLSVDRVQVRDFSLMIQSVGMTSACIFILGHLATTWCAFNPLLWSVQLCLAGLVMGVPTLLMLPVFITQALFLSLIITFCRSLLEKSRLSRFWIWHH